jgi:putative transcriptional regulator
MRYRFLPQMTQEKLLRMVSEVLTTAGFQVSERCGLRPRSFDLIAGNDRTLLVIKVIAHIDGVSEEIARDLDLIARYLHAVPFIVGERARETDLERGAVYLRYGIFAVSVTTLYDSFVEGVPPLVYVSPGGLYVNIDQDLLHELREERQLSLGDLAYRLGVSRRTISKYESGMGTTMDIAARIEELFDTAVVKPIDLLRYRSHFSEEPEPEGPAIIQEMERLGLESHMMRRAPFEVLSRLKEHTILTGYGTAQRVVKRAPLIGNISRIARAHAVCIITNWSEKRRIGNTLVIGEESLQAMEEGSEFIDLLHE